MDYEAERAALEGYFQTNWVGGSVAWPNVVFEPTPGTPWLRFNIQPGAADYVSMASVRRPGQVIIQIFAPEHSGSKPARDIADAVLALFPPGLRIATDILCRAPYMTNVGNRDGWYQVNVSVPYWHDQAA